MALQVWLPLNGNLNNQGLSNITVTNNGATVDNNGKIGKCYAFNGSSKITNTLPTSINNNIGTLACWFKITSLPSSSSFYNLMQLGNFGGYATCRFGVYMEYSNRINISIDGSGVNSNAYTHSLTTNQWYHLCATHDGTTVKLYIDGAEVLSKASTKGSYKTAASYLYVGGTSSYYLKGSMNDIRYYNRALSPKEVEILSRGLVCHYPLNNNGGGQPNLYNFESVARLWKTGSEELIFVDATDDVYGNVLKIIVDSVRIYRGVKNVWKADTNFTVSFLAKASKTAVLKIERGKTDYAPDVTVGTTWKRYSTVISCTATTTGGALGITSDTAGADIYLTQIKVELGDKATAYCPGVGDSHYIPLGYDSTTEYDVSGYGNNGTKNGTIAYSNDTARYSVSTTFNGSNTYIEADPLPSETATIACWLKTPWAYVSGAYQLVIHDKNTGLAIGWSGSNMITYVGSGNGGTGSYLNTSGIWQANKWMHVVVVKTGSTTRDIYINGVKQSPSGVNYWGGDLNKLNIGNRHISGSYSAYFNGQISDFRAYATALSATQVAELYNTAVSVANNGTLMGYELVEV